MEHEDMTTKRTFKMSSGSRVTAYSSPMMGKGNTRSCASVVADIVAVRVHGEDCVTTVASLASPVFLKRIFREIIAGPSPSPTSIVAAAERFPAYWCMAGRGCELAGKTLTGEFAFQMSPK